MLSKGWRYYEELGESCRAGTGREARERSQIPPEDGCCRRTRMASLPRFCAQCGSEGWRGGRVKETVALGNCFQTPKADCGFGQWYYSAMWIGNCSCLHADPCPHCTRCCVTEQAMFGQVLNLFAASFVSRQTCSAVDMLGFGCWSCIWM